MTAQKLTPEDRIKSLRKALEDRLAARPESCGLSKCEGLAQMIKDHKVQRPEFRDVKNMSMEEFSESHGWLDAWITLKGQLELESRLAESPLLSNGRDWRDEKMAMGRIEI